MRDRGRLGWILVLWGVWAFAAPAARADPERTIETRWRFTLDPGLEGATIDSLRVEVVSADGLHRFGVRFKDRGAKTKPDRARVRPGTLYRLALKSGRLEREGRRRFRLDSRAFEIAPGQWWSPEAAEGPVPLSFKVRRRTGTGKLLVRVTNRRAEPVPFAKITLSTRRARDLIWTAQTDTDGVARFDGLLSNQYEVRIAELDGRKEPVMHGRRGARPYRARVQLKEGQPVGDVSFVVEQSGALSVVLDQAPRGPIAIGLRHLWPDRVWRPISYRHPRRDGNTWEFTGLPAGRYQVRAHCIRRPLAVAQITVGKTPVTCRMKIKEAPPREIHGLWVRRGSMRAEFLRVHLNALDGSGHVVYGGLKPGKSAALFAPSIPAPGRYLMILWDAHLIRQVELGAEAKQELRVDPPEGLARAAKGRSVSVRVLGRDGLLDRLCVGLAPRRKKDADGVEGWMRYASTGVSKAVFEEVPPGVYEVRVYDGVFGVSAGFGRPLEATVELKDKDVEISIEAFGPEPDRKPKDR